MSNSENTAKTAPEAALTRVSIRHYTSEPISRDEITRIVELTGKAPSAWNIQPWRVIAVTNQDVKDKLQAAAFHQPQVGSAPVVFVLTSDMEAALEDLASAAHPQMPEDKQAEMVATVSGIFANMSLTERAAWGRNQTNIALGYLLLLLESLGYGSSPMLGFVPVTVREILGLADHVEIPALVAVGHAAAPGYPQHRNPVEKILTVIE